MLYLANAFVPLVNAGLLEKRQHRKKWLFVNMRAAIEDRNKYVPLYKKALQLKEKKAKVRVIKSSA